MRWMIAIVLAVLACGKSENAGIEEAKRQAEAEQKAKEAHGEVAKKLTPPVPGQATLPCSQVIDADKFQQALGEAAPITVVEAKAEKHDPDAAASCSLMRGGKRPSDAEQKAMIKQSGRLGVLPGDEICNVSLYCWTIEDPDHFKKRCAEQKKKDDDSLGFYSCVMVVATGEDDVNNYRFYDDDTKCLIGVRGGPSNVDNNLIGKCAKAAHDLIGPDQIKVSAPAK
ncbi:MAG TPA: hypothetical protein VMJ10_32220 [Kofleriaceae bacterium]|nr:hypothetical protein [Kofleriaceae bacterium]